MFTTIHLRCLLWALPTLGQTWVLIWIRVKQAPRSCLIRSLVCSALVVQAPKANTVTMLYDPTPITRSVNMTDWNSEGSKVATAYAIMDFQQQPEGMSLDSYIWDLANPNEPEFTMQPLSQVVSAKFNLKDPNIVGAGLYNGQFAVFDTRKGSRQVSVLVIEQLAELNGGMRPVARMHRVIMINTGSPSPDAAAEIGIPQLFVK